MGTELFLIPPHLENGSNNHAAFCEKCVCQLGVLVAEYKMKGPDCIVTFPGIGFDNLTGELHLTHDKLQCLEYLVGY